MDKISIINYNHNTTPCYSTTTKIEPGSIYNYYPINWTVSTSQYSDFPVVGNSTYYATFEPPFSYYPTLQVFWNPLPIFVF